MTSATGQRRKEMEKKHSHLTLDERIVIEQGKVRGEKKWKRNTAI